MKIEVVETELAAAADAEFSESLDEVLASIPKPELARLYDMLVEAKARGMDSYRMSSPAPGVLRIETYRKAAA